jgi:hypothetical protein
MSEPTVADPMIEVSDAHIAPTSPNSRLRPTSAGVVVVTAESDAMLNLLSGSTTRS